jgi:oligoribonuclease NrnB/cAMP/cGMP phosphodiesterase (DHH superfamily)
MDSGYLLHVEHDEYAKRVEEEFSRVNHRLKDIEEDKKEQRELLIAVNKLADNMESMQKEVKAQGDKIQEIENRDGEKWRKAEWLVVTGFITGIIGFIVGQLF